MMRIMSSDGSGSTRDHHYYLIRVLVLLCVLLLLTLFACCCSATAAAASSYNNQYHHYHRHRKACGLYIWDAPSALLSRWCNHLQRDCIYEGRGGKKFIRIPPGSILQLLYPCSRYSPDKCLICGGKFRDHLELWWSKHLYTPFDMYVDQVNTEGIIVRSTNNNNNNSNKQKNKKQHKLKHFVDNEQAPTFAFHRRYVLDLSEALHGVSGPKQRRKVLQQQIAKRYPNISSKNNNNKDDDATTYELRAVRSSSSTPYAVPSTKSSNKTSSLTLQLVRAFMIASIDRVIGYQRIDRQREEQKARKLL